ncbi:MAG TPA: hypothetical protein VF771_01265 [Longimicrobiaceae bacterium]
MISNRDELLRRRRELQQRIFRDAQRQRIAGVLAQLDAAGAAYDILWPGEVGPADWTDVAARFPAFGMHRFDWSRVPGSVWMRWDDEAERDRQFRTLLDEHVPAPETPVIVVRNGSGVALRLTAAAAREHCAALLEHASEAWIFAPGQDWLIECTSDGTLAAGRG